MILLIGHSNKNSNTDMQQDLDFYFTCGYSHRHELQDDVVWDHNSVLHVVALSYEHARKIVFSLVGNVWGFQYDSLEDLELDKFYDNGICLKLHHSQFPNISVS